MYSSDDLALMHYLQTGGFPLGHEAKRAFNPRFNENSLPEIYIWRTRGDNRVSSAHAANDGKVFFRDAPLPSTGHPGQGYGCRCEAEAVALESLDLPAEALGELEAFTIPANAVRGLPESILSELYVIDERDLGNKVLLGLGKIVVRATPALIARLRRQASRAAGKVSREFIARNWKPRYKNKSPTRWENQFRKRGWTYAQVRHFILKGRRTEAENYPKPKNGATRYQIGDDFIIIDDTTHELLQISDKTRPFYQ